jgi:hypothetical protein
LTVTHFSPLWSMISRSVSKYRTLRDGGGNNYVFMGVSGAPINKNNLILKTPSQAIGRPDTRKRPGRSETTRIRQDHRSFPNEPSSILPVFFTAPYVSPSSKRKSRSAHPTKPWGSLRRTTMLPPNPPFTVGRPVKFSRSRSGKGKV